MLQTPQEMPRTQTGWMHVAVTVVSAVGVGAALVVLVLSSGLDTYDRVGHAASHLAVGLPAALAAVLAWRWWPRQLPSRISTVGAAILRVVLVVFCLGTAMEVVAALSAADPDGDGLLHNIGLIISVPSTFAVLAGLGILLLGGIVTAAVALRRVATGRPRAAREGSGSLL